MEDKKFVADYSMMCRTCLQSDGEMLYLSALTSDKLDDGRSKISYLECLKMCIPFSETSDLEMPERICLECASALQVSYWFIKNANRAQELLKMKLTEIKQKRLQIEMKNPADGIKPKRYRCKICNVKVETKRSLKDHVKLHLDIIVYNCQLCSYESHNRNNLSSHYVQIHDVEASRDDLKPKTKLPSSSANKISDNSQMDGAIKSDLFQILPEEPQQISHENLTRTDVMNTFCDAQPLHISTMPVAANSNYNSISAPFTEIGRTLNNDQNLANEFMIMEDGSLGKVLNKDVVIEYIDAQNQSSNITLGNGLVLDNIIELPNTDSSMMLDHQSDIQQMDVDDLIIEDPGDVMEETQVQANIILPLEEETIPATFIEQPKKIMCKICTKDFLSQEQLKNHMLTHNEIPHFFCDQCKFYTFFKIDLHQHYKSKHNLQPTNKQLQPKNKQKKPGNEFYACDLCFYEAEVRLDLKKHYKTKHNIEANEMHLKATKIEKLKSSRFPLCVKTKAPSIVNKPTTVAKNIQIRTVEETTPDYPNGLNCRKCHEVFYWRNKLYEHYKMHNAEETAQRQEKQIIKIQSKSSVSNLSKNKTKNIRTPAVQTSKTSQLQLQTTNTSSYSSVGSLVLNVSTANINTLHSAAPLTPSSSSTYTLPSDAVPQIVETDQTIENDVDFVFNCDDDALFEDFDDDVDVENDSDENDSEFRNVLLTSDDDLEEMLQNKIDMNSNSATIETIGSFCAHCQKSFLSRYQFENHMFVHRGLAPYRCEMCTNIYNTKRCLIRHYKAVHKNVPTRDMIQAKGDKVCDDTTSIELLNLEPTTCLMCGKCPYETRDLNNIKSHLISCHNVNDEAFIIKKLPFECPRCIRSFASKMTLLKHLERNHSLTPINQQQHFFNSANKTSTMATSTTVTPITTTVNTHVNMMKSEPIETDACCGKINKDTLTNNINTQAQMP